MREIKFRVWTRDEMRYVSMENELQLNFGINNGWSLWEIDGEVCNHKHGELMQFTGLKDKNGKEIYEGDIIKSTLGYIAAVEWEKEGRFIGFTVERSILYINREPAVEIIGNIYENPKWIANK